MVVLRAGLYPRVSTEEQAKYGYSIKAQIDDLMEYCEKNSIKVVDVYNDEGVSGGRPALKRPAMTRLLDDVRAGKIDVVLFTKLDRWFRNVKEYYKVQDILDEFGVSWRAIQEDFETQTSAGRFKVNIMLSVAQQERERGAERVSAVLENKRKNREACFGGAAVPFGYKKEKDADGVMRLVKDPETQQACQEFWDILVSTNNMNKAIRHMANAYGIKKNWKSWSRMAKSDFYCGVHRGVPDYCEPYVSVADFLKFQESRPIKATRSGQVYLFRALIRCPVCGHKLCGDTSKKSYGIYKAYRCTNRCTSCSFGASISEKKLEKHLLTHIEEYLRDEISVAEVEQAKPKPKPKTNVKALKETHRRLTVAYMAGNMPDEQYLREDAELKALIAKAEAEAPPAPRDVSPLKELLQTDFRSIYDSLTVEERQRFWQGLIKEIPVTEEKQILRPVFF